MAAAIGALISQEIEQEDRLGKLPEDVLISILKYLNLREAVRCSILSRRWRHIPNVLSDIVLDVECFKPNNDDGFKSTVSNTAYSNMALARAAKSVLGRKSDRPISRLDVTFYLRNESMGIVRAVDGAMSPAGGRGVVAAEFSIVGEKMDFQCTWNDLVRQGNLFLKYFNACPRAFAGLTGLHLESVTLGEFGIPNVLRTCQKLESLSLLNCDSGRRMVLVLEHPQLADLVLGSCDTAELRWLPKLAQVTCCGWVPSQHADGYPLLFGHVPLLRSVRISNAGYNGYPTLLLSKLLSNLDVLSKLYLDFESERIWIQPEGPEQLAPLLRNLRIVTLDKIFQECDLTWTLFLLRAAPQLKTLKIKVSSHDCVPVQVPQRFVCEKKSVEWKLSDFKHNNFAVLEIYGFEQSNTFMGYIRRVMEAAMNLELIALNDHEWCQHCRFRPTINYPRTKEERDLIRKQINEGLYVKDVQFCEMSSKGPIRIFD